ncbi:unnamed protein product [Hyaloperonospora brassicae]|uniref:C2H2-type domain-containing protein n=1 Tax=Hyaloperonospora brassicae TaxID=162125 RepID=A0AAV0UF88_HYABA|nr:unnamed protein product [Hyaloperonospora brassicae]
MVGNKHKNGIICTYPHCNKTMRTQKFKMHFVRAHLKNGEDYSVEHRRRYEVAREETARQAVEATNPTDGLTAAGSPVLLPIATTATTTATITEGEEGAEGAATRDGDVPSVDVTSLPSSRSPVRNKTSVTSYSKSAAGTVGQSQQLPLPVQAEGVEVKREETSDPSSTPTPIRGGVSTAAPSGHAGEQARGSKRSAAASTVEVSAEHVDPTSALMMQFVALMDQRFQELVGKMGEMIDVQKELIDTLQASNPHGKAPASAFSHAIDVVMKRRKKNTTPCDKESLGEDGAGRSHSDTDGTGHSSSGFEL